LGLIKPGSPHQRGAKGIVGDAGAIILDHNHDRIIDSVAGETNRAARPLRGIFGKVAE